MKNMRLIATILLFSACGCGSFFPDIKPSDELQMIVYSSDGKQSYASTEKLFTREKGTKTPINQLKKNSSNTMMSKITGLCFDLNPDTDASARQKRVQYLDLTPLKKRLAQIPVDLTAAKGDEIKAGET